MGFMLRVSLQQLLQIDHRAVFAGQQVTTPHRHGAYAAIRQTATGHRPKNQHLSRTAQPGEMIQTQAGAQSGEHLQRQIQGQEIGPG